MWYVPFWSSQKALYNAEVYFFMPEVMFSVAWSFEQGDFIMKFFVHWRSYDVSFAIVTVLNRVFDGLLISLLLFYD